MNRQTILTSVDHHLRESFAETGEVRPLGEIVPRVALEIRSGSTLLATAPVRIIPIERVAAFVDGDLESAEADMICEAVMVDNSVLAEIIAAVRALQTPLDQMPPLSATLSAQLLAMHSMPKTVQTGDDSVDAVPSQLTGSTKIHVLPRQTPATRSKRSRRNRGLWVATGLLAVAATIAAAIVLLGGPRRVSPHNQQIAVDRGAQDQAPQPNAIPNVTPESSKHASPRGPDQGIVENELPTTRPESPRRELDVPVLSAADVPEQNPVIAANTLDSEPITKDTSPAVMPIPPGISPLVDRDPVRIVEAPRLSDLRWTEVSGLLAQRNELSEVSGSRGAPTWKRIQEGSGSDSTLAAEQNRVALRTLPLSRAKAELDSGGGIVIASDTGLQMTRGGTDTSVELDLMYGSIAMIDLAEGTTIELRRGTRPVAILRWQGKASVVVQRERAGLQIQVDGGEIEVNDAPVKDESVRIADDQTIEKVQMPKRLPRWITRPDESTAAERMILAQIADTEDLMTSLNRQIIALASSPALSGEETRTLAKLASWQAAMAGPSLMRLVGSRIPALRLAALQRLAELSENDPRYELTWNAIERSMNNAQRIAQVRQWFRLLQNGTRPNAVQLEELINGLSTRDLAGRALCDYVLRRFVANPPPFDPSWSGPTLQRAVNIYRDRAGLPAAPARPNPAAADVR